jgi:hypothetical protein
MVSKGEHHPQMALFKVEPVIPCRGVAGQREDSWPYFSYFQVSELLEFIQIHMI